MNKYIKINSQKKLTVFIKQQVIWLDVSVNNPLFVEVVEGKGDFGSIKTNRVFSDRSRPVKSVPQVSSQHQIQNPVVRKEGMVLFKPPKEKLTGEKKKDAYMNMFSSSWNANWRLTIRGCLICSNSWRSWITFCTAFILIHFSLLMYLSA